MSSEPRTAFGRFFRLTLQEETNLFRYLRFAGAATLLAVILLAPLIRSGYFREQAQLKQARKLVEQGQYHWCAVQGDGIDPLQTLPLNSPYRPRWSGQRQPDGTYLVTYTYHYKKKTFEHRWEVNLSANSVQPLTERTKVPALQENGGYRCVDQ